MLKFSSDLFYLLNYLLLTVSETKYSSKILSTAFIFLDLTLKILKIKPISNPLKIESLISYNPQGMEEEDLLAAFGTVDLYKILGIERSCNAGVIKKAYHKKSLKVSWPLLINMLINIIM